MGLKDKSILIDRETKYKELVYKRLDERLRQKQELAKRSDDNIELGDYENQAAFTVYSERAQAHKQLDEAEKEYSHLKKSPYFGHIEVREDKDGKNAHFFLSDCESLAEVIPIESCNGLLLPFKKDPLRKASEYLYHCFTHPTGENITYEVAGKKVSILPIAICDDTIEFRELINAYQRYPQNEFIQVSADDLLKIRLDENRNDANLRNIISTLQVEQFKIIKEEVDVEFVVQGCAGSGKSQCLLHRLFYLRDELSEDGWSHVLLITPTQLFRNYSMELMRRYQLSDINNCSLCELYREILIETDRRFKALPYKIELSDEYLPISYLKYAYSKKTIAEIDKSIKSAIHKHIKAACALLGIKFPHDFDSNTIKSLISLFDEEIRLFDEREEVLTNDLEYLEKRNNLEGAEKKLNSISKNLEKCKRKKKGLELLKEMTLQQKMNAMEDEDLNQEYDRLKERITAHGNMIAEKEKRLSLCYQEIEEYSTWLKEHALKLTGKNIDTTLKRSELVKMRRSLLNLERVVFDKVVWEFLRSYKENNDVQLIIKPDDEKKHSLKVLYKLDLMFYVRIYSYTHRLTKEFNYNLICIDEGQDLYSADYETIRLLFPMAKLNIFGDIGQVLKDGCGIRNWKDDTGIETVWELNRNYRNIPEIVDFCNLEFNAQMESIGSSLDDEYPDIICSAYEFIQVLENNPDVVIIVKNKQTFSQLCGKLKDTEIELEFLDTNSERKGFSQYMCYSIYAAKGLEFKKVIVYSKDMTVNQKVVACTRAMKKLYYWE